MTHTPEDILSILNACASDWSFPAMDNGYVYLAATRMTLFRSEADWALVFEVFGFSPRAGSPDIFISTFGSQIANKAKPTDYVNAQAYENYLANHEYNDSHVVHPVEGDDWQDEETLETVAPWAQSITVRSHILPLPIIEEYADAGVNLGSTEQVEVFELCRYLAAKHREWVLSTPEELRYHVPEGVQQILQLDEWHHPDLCAGELPGESETFRQLAQVLVTGDVSVYQPTEAPNTHWVNWPEGGTL